MRGKYWTISIGLVALGIIGGVWWEGHRSPSPSVSPMTAMTRANQRAYQQFLNRLIQQHPVLKSSHGQILPQDMGLTPQETQIRGIAPGDQITGIRTVWKQNAAYIIDASRQLGATGIPPTVWQAGLHQAAQDLTTLVGNDPLKGVLNAGPATAPKFWALEQALYTGPTGKFAEPHWILRIQATPKPYPHGPSVRVYPVTHQIPGAPTAVILLRVPVILNEIGVVPRPGGKTTVRSVIQTGGAIMGLTHSHGRWQWWAEQITIHAVANTLGTPSK